MVENSQSPRGDHEIVLEIGNIANAKFQKSSSEQLRAWLLTVK